MRLIDADALRHWIEGECKSPSIPRSEAAFGKRILMHMELMGHEDVQPVVRCKDCVWRDEFGHWLGCPILNTDDDNYCSYAERRTDAD